MLTHVLHVLNLINHFWALVRSPPFREPGLSQKCLHFLDFLFESNHFRPRLPDPSPSGVLHFRGPEIHPPTPSSGPSFFSVLIAACRRELASLLGGRALCRTIRTWGMLRLRAAPLIAACRRDCALS